MSTVHKDISNELLDGLKALLEGNVTYSGVTYPVYKNIPKPPEEVYVKLGPVIHDEDGTKDDFIYYGTVQVSVIYESQLRPGASVPKAINNIVRGLLKPSKTSVPSCDSLTVITFTPGAYDEIIEQSEHGTRVQITDIYNFQIE